MERYPFIKGLVSVLLPVEYVALGSGVAAGEFRARAAERRLRDAAVQRLQ